MTEYLETYLKKNAAKLLPVERFKIENVIKIIKRVENGTQQGTMGKPFN